MKISFNWLKQYIKTDLSAKAIADLLTASGLEVESVEEWQSVKGGLKGIVVGEVMECGKHPGADRLSLCKVDAGTGVQLQIVCGAPNVAAGQKVMVALPGTKLFPVSGEPFEIKKSKIRGEASEGMLCAEDEVGLGTSHAGLLVLSPDAKIGSPVSDYLGVENDYVFEIGLTPNRADAASHIGVARDLCAIFAKADATPLVRPSVEEFNASLKPCPVDVKVLNEESCYRYSGIYIKGINVTDSPLWLQNRLKAVGLRPINNVVDVTNYVMLETGQPLHAFDAGKIKGNKIFVKNLPAGTVFKTLDGVDRKLNGTELMICNESEGICMAGVFGGIDAGVSYTTTAIFLESAWFNPVSIRKTARLHGLHTDSSFRFERGTDPEGTIYAIKRVAMLLKEICGADTASEIIDIYNRIAEPFKVQLKHKYLAELCGAVIPAEKIRVILDALEIRIERETEEYMDLAVPPFKVDVTRPADVVEEILRIYGYNEITLPGKIKSSMPVFNAKDTFLIQQKTTSWLVANGYNEVINNSLTNAKYHDLAGMNAETSVKILNPLSSDLSIMRSSILFSGLETIQYNQNRQQSRLRIFEFAKSYLKNAKGYFEISHLCLWLAGERSEENWQQNKSGYDIYYIKRVVLNLLESCEVDITKIAVAELNDSMFSFGLSCVAGKKEVARFGIVNKEVTKTFDLSSDVFYADINLDVMMHLITFDGFKAMEPPRFPEVRRDLSMILDRSVKYEQLEQLVHKEEPKLLKRINLFDVYEGDKIEAGKKSYAISFFLRDDEGTLKEQQIDTVMKRLMDAFETKLGAVIRRV